MVVKKAKVSNVPNLRFPGFEGEEHNPYKKYFFKDIFLFSTGRNIKQDQASPEFEIPCVRYGELYYMYSEVINEVINRTNLDKSELLFSKGDEVLLPSAGEDPLDIGLASALTIENVAIGRTINILRPINANVYSQIYVSYYINQKLRKKISTLAKGSSISNVYNSDLKTLEIVLPNLDEQTKLASFLSLIDARIQTQSKIIQRLEASIRIAREKILAQKLRFKDRYGNSFPNWEITKLEEVAIKKSSNISANKIAENVGEYVIYGASGILKSVDFYEEEDNYVSIIKDGAGVGRLFYCEGKSSVLGTMEIIKPSNGISAYFLFCLLSTVDFTKYVIGSTIPHIYFKDYKHEAFGIPCIEEQNQITDFLSSLSKKIQIEKTLLEKYVVYKKHLLANLFI